MSTAPFNCPLFQFVPITTPALILGNKKYEKFVTLSAVLIFRKEEGCWSIKCHYRNCHCYGLNYMFKFAEQNQEYIKKKFVDKNINHYP